MNYGRKLAYAIILAWYYTFIVVYSIELGFTDVLITTLAITIVSYVWVLMSASHFVSFSTLNYKDLVINVFVYFFISFYIAGLALIFSGHEITPVRAMLLVSPISVWSVIWMDYYVSNLRG